MAEEKEHDLTTRSDWCSRRKDLEKALVAWEEVGTELKRLLAAAIPEELSDQELESKTEKLLYMVKTLDLKPQYTFTEKQYFKIGEVSEMLNVEPYVLRYWQSEFKIPKSGRLLYHRKDVEKLELIKDLVYGEKFTIAGAKACLREIYEEKSSD